MLKNYEEQFQKIKQEAGTDNWDEIGKEYTEHQKETYAIYKFTNGLSEELKDKIAEQQRCKTQLQELKAQMVLKYSSARQAQLDEVTQNLSTAKKNNQKHR